MVKAYRWFTVLVVFPPALAALGFVWDMTPYVVASVPMMIGTLAGLLFVRRGAGWYERLLQEGAPATIAVIEVNEVEVNHLGHVLALRLVVTGPGQSGAERDGRATVNAHHRRRIKPGAELSIRVDRNKPNYAAIAWTTSE